MINKSDIDRYREDIKQHGVEGAIRVYSELLGKGYNYAGWAKGVAKGDTPTGETAILFMQDSSGRHFSESELNPIRVDMAGGYLDALEANMKETGGKTNTDVTFFQAREFHKSVFEKHELRIENWTLEEPMKLAGKYGYGKQSQDQAWQRLMETKGEGAAAIVESLALYGMVSDFTDGVISVDKNGRYNGPFLGPQTSYQIPIYGERGDIRSVDEQDRKDAQLWIKHATQIRAVLHAEAQRISGEDIALAQAAPAQQISLESLPENAQRIYHSGKAHLEAFYQKNNQSYSEESLNNAAMALTALGYEKGMSDIPLFNFKNRQFLIGERNPGLITASMEVDRAITMPVEESVNRIQQTELEEQNRQMVQSQSRGMSLS
ncbi:hypothetical protein [Neisseria sp.]|uniref:hypothetical protein n=1 Tax=Neisseria sp. TaxID=192066 RepID=UPI0026DD0898|nr:hypothetical protein [Neisseria sp.]